MSYLTYTLSILIICKLHFSSWEEIYNPKKFLSAIFGKVGKFCLYNAKQIIFQAVILVLLQLIHFCRPSNVS